jgi:hypothetical protein
MRFADLGHAFGMDESILMCAMKPCTQPVAMTLLLLVDGHEANLSACQDHSVWLRAYAEDDDAVQIAGEVPATEAPPEDTSLASNM